MGVWNYFGNFDNDKFICNKCNGLFAKTGGAANLARHLKNVHKIVASDKVTSQQRRKARVTAHIKPPVPCPVGKRPVVNKAVVDKAVSDAVVDLDEDEEIENRQSNVAEIPEVSEVKY